MVFSSHVFIFYFLPVALLIYYALYRAPQRARNAALIVLGYIFYGWANPKFIFLMFGTTFVDWVLSLVIARNSWRFWQPWREERSRRWRKGPVRLPSGARILLSVISNLASLGFFKYFNFGVDSYNALLTSLGYWPLAVGRPSSAYCCPWGSASTPSSR